jgi:hypothetical protein
MASCQLSAGKYPSSINSLTEQVKLPLVFFCNSEWFAGLTTSKQSFLFDIAATCCKYNDFSMPIVDLS